MGTKINIPSIHIEGQLERNEDWVQLDDGNYDLAKTIEEKISQALEEYISVIPYSKAMDSSWEDDDFVISMFLEKVFFRVYFSNKKCSLEEAEAGFAIYSLGGTGNMDLFESWYGYSEWTILGFDVENFKLTDGNGNGHDLAQIFEEHANEYVHIVIDILEI